ncbi:MAG TPA: protein translocase subunit SecF, partial [Candidatus Binatia bacterium]|nr:protein translocase subunit SecF [Candidatus Binatia bacterium]
MELIKPGTKIPFTRYRKIALIASTLINLLVLALLFTKGPNLGVDFAGGTMVQLRFARQVSIDEIRQALEGVQLGSSSIQEFGQSAGNEYLVRVDAEAADLTALGERVKTALSTKFGGDKFEVRRIEAVGAKIGADLRQRGTLSVIAATIMMGVYIWIRFSAAFGGRFGLLFGVG